jgi:hypothetical protein
VDCEPATGTFNQRVADIGDRPVSTLFLPIVTGLLTGRCYADGFGKIQYPELKLAERLLDDLTMR